MRSLLLHKTVENRDGHLQSGMEGGAGETFDRLAELLHQQLTGESIQVAEPMEREIEITRIFDAPRELVFKAWTEPEPMMQWWGPRVFTNHSCVLDVRPGGARQIVMRAPDGTDWPCRGVYSEVVRPERLVFANNAFDQNDKPLLEGYPIVGYTIIGYTTVTFEDVGGKTKLTLKTRAMGLVEFAPMMLRGMEPGWNQSLDRLAAHVSH